MQTYDTGEQLHELEAHQGSEQKPLRYKSELRLHPKGWPRTQKWCHPKYQSRISFIPSIAGKFHPPMQSSQEREHYSTICDLEVHATVEKVHSRGRVDMC